MEITPPGHATECRLVSYQLEVTLDIYTIGFTRKSAEEFFSILQEAKIERFVDVRVNNTSQLAGFTKRDDLGYFLRTLLGTEYVHEPLLAPTKELLKSYRSGDMAWKDYEKAFFGLMEERRIEREVPRHLFASRTVLMCSEPGPEQCHRRLVVEYLDQTWDNVQGIHL